MLKATKLFAYINSKIKNLYFNLQQTISATI